MTSHVTIAALATEFVGAVVLARGLAFERPKTYIAGEGTGRWDYNPPADIARASENAHALVGLGLIATGFAGQMVWAAGADPAWWVAYLAAAAVTTLTLVAMPWERRRRERGMVRARFEDPRNYAVKGVVESYVLAVEAHYPRVSRGGDDAVAFAEKRWGTKLWKDVRRPS